MVSVDFFTGFFTALSILGVAVLLYLIFSDYFRKRKENRRLKRANRLHIKSIKCYAEYRRLCCHGKR